MRRRSIPHAHRSYGPSRIQLVATTMETCTPLHTVSTTTTEHARNTALKVYPTQSLWFTKKHKDNKTDKKKPTTEYEQHNAQPHTVHLGQGGARPRGYKAEPGSGVIDLQGRGGAGLTWHRDYQLLGAVWGLVVQTLSHHPHPIDQALLQASQSHALGVVHILFLPHHLLVLLLLLASTCRTEEAGVFGSPSRGDRAAGGWDGCIVGWCWMRTCCVRLQSRLAVFYD